MESLELCVTSPSGQCATVSMPQFGTVRDLKKAVQQALGRPFLSLVAPDGHLLDPSESLQDAGLQDGDAIAAVAQRPKVAATSGAFALWCQACTGVVTWGDPKNGGDSHAVQDHLRNVQHVYASRRRMRMQEVDRRMCNQC
eukprot:Skav226403  [mRNA]  locus=scaffold3989:135594:137472:- [translate_table: standard]